MKKLIYKVLILIPVLFILNSSFLILNCFSQWQSDVRLTNALDTSVSYSTHARCIISNGNIVHSIWQDNRDGNMEIYYKHSTNGGVIWEQDTRLTNNPSRSTNPAVALSGSTVYVVWQDDRDGFWEIYYRHSTDEGLTWGPETRLTVINTGAASFPSIAVSGLFVHVFWHDARNGPQQEIYCKRSTDGGGNWSQDIRLTNYAGYSWYPSCEINGSIIHLAWMDNREGTYQVYYKFSTDSGLNWDVDTKLSNTNMSSSPRLHLASAGLLIFVVWHDNRDGNYEIYYKRSTDGGISWSADTRLTNDPAASYYPFVVVSGLNAHIVWYDNRDGNNEIYYKLSTDGGANWGVDTRLTYDPAVSFYPSMSISNSVLHIVWCDNRDGNMEIYYKRNPTGNVGIQNINSEIPKEYKLMHNYPNPFNPITKIKFDIPSDVKRKTLNVKLLVYDILGKEIATLVNESLQPGTYEVEWNAQNYTSGVYFYRLETNGYNETRKMLLLK